MRCEPPPSNSGDAARAARALHPRSRGAERVAVDVRRSHARRGARHPARRAADGARLRPRLSPAAGLAAARARPALRGRRCPMPQLAEIARGRSPPTADGSATPLVRRWAASAVVPRGGAPDRRRAGPAARRAPRAARSRDRSGPDPHRRESRRHDPRDRQRARSRAAQGRLPGDARARAAQPAGADPDRGRAAGADIRPPPASRTSSSATRATSPRLVDDLLDISRVTRGHVELRASSLAGVGPRARGRDRRAARVAAPAPLAGRDAPRA